MSSQQIELKPVPAFEIVINGNKLAPFRVMGEWNGLTELRNELGWKLIVAFEPQATVTALFDALLTDPAHPTPRRARVVLASPDLIALLRDDVVEPRDCECTHG